MSKQTATARKDGRTAGKTAQARRTVRGAKWRIVETKRGPALKSPGGRLYYGTSAELRGSRLMPWRIVRIPADAYVELCAASRLLGFESFDDFLADLWTNEIEAARDFAESVTGSRNIPLARQEHAELARYERMRKPPREASALEELRRTDANAPRKK